jgi:hypothetical protein
LFSALENGFAATYAHPATTGGAFATWLQKIEMVSRLLRECLQERDILARNSAGVITGSMLKWDKIQICFQQLASQ